jgi:hypothetical protein
VKGNSSCYEALRELLAGAKQQWIISELALELHSENIVGNDGGPPLKGQDIGV